MFLVTDWILYVDRQCPGTASKQNEKNQIWGVKRQIKMSHSCFCQEKNTTFRVFGFGFGFRAIFISLVRRGGAWGASEAKTPPLFFLLLFFFIYFLHSFCSFFFLFVLFFVPFLLLFWSLKRFWRAEGWMQYVNSLHQRGSTTVVKSSTTAKKLASTMPAPSSNESFLFCVFCLNQTELLWWLLHSSHWLYSCFDYWTCAGGTQK